MELRLLEYFIAVCEELHFTRAAERIGISQPTLSQQIRLLEARLGTPLFQRVGKKTYLTEAGEVLRNHSMRIFHELQQANAGIRELRGLQRGRLRIGCSGMHLLTDPIIAFHQRYPAIELSVQELATDETRKLLLDNKLDLGLVFLPVEDQELTSIPLYEESLCLVTNAPPACADSEAIALAALPSLRMAMLPPKFLARQMIDQICHDAGINPISPVIEMSTLEALVQVAEQGIPAILPRSYAARLIHEGLHVLAIKEPTPMRKAGILYRKETYMSAALEAFIAHLTEVYA